MVLVVNIKAIDLDLAKGTEIYALAGASTKEIPELDGERSCLIVRREGRDRFGAAQREKDSFAGRLAGLDAFGKVGAGEKACGTFGGRSFTGRIAGRAEVEGWVATRAGKGGEKGEDNNVNVRVGANLGEWDLTGRGRLAIVDTNILGGGDIEGVRTTAGARGGQAREGTGSSGGGREGGDGGGNYGKKRGGYCIRRVGHRGA